MPEQPQQGSMNINMPPEMVPGVYADFAGIWHTSETFILDFMALAKPYGPNPNQPGEVLRQAQIVSRVRIPAAQVWEIMKALEQQYSAWEIERGQRKPDDPELPK